MAYYDALIAKWVTLSGTTAERLAAINALTVAGPDRAVPISEVMTYLRSNNLWLPIKNAAATNSAAAAAVDIAGDLRAVEIDFGLQVVSVMLALLVVANLLSQAQSDELMAMKKTTIPWSQVNGYSTPVSMSDVSNAGLS